MSGSVDVYNGGIVFENACNGMGRADVERMATESKRRADEVEAHNDVLKKALRIALDENAVMQETLTRSHARCTELLLELRAIRESSAAT